MSGLSLESVLLEYGASEVSAMEVYSDIFQLGDGFIQTEGEPGGLHKANPIILGSFGGYYDSDGKLVGEGDAAESCSRTRSSRRLLSSASELGDNERSHLLGQGEHRRRAEQDVRHDFRPRRAG